MRKMLSLMAGLLLLGGQLLAQTRTVTGIIRDDKGSPVANVSVVVKGTSTGTTSKNDGTFSLTVPNSARTLVASAIGFSAQEINLTASNSYVVSLASNAVEQVEVIVTGITRQKKSEYAGAASKIDEKQIRNQPVGSFDQIFQGRVPGVLGLTGSGQPGNPATIIIRGQSSIEGGSTPLYIVDGIPVEAGAFQNLNANDFASIDVLRDASASALYGSRGSAGVIVITTKKGATGKMKLSYSGQMGIKNRPNFTYDMMNSKQLLQAQEDYGKILQIDPASSASIPGWRYSKQNPVYATLSPADQARYDFILDSLGDINTDWRDQFFRNGTFSNHQISLSGGTGKTRVYSSLGLYNEEGTTYRTDMKRVTFRNNIDYADDNFTLGITSNIGYTKRNFQQSTTTNSLSNPFLVANVTVPYVKVRNPDGSYATGTDNKYVANNVLDVTALDRNYNDQIKGTLGVNASYKITDHITAAVTTGIDFRETQASNYGSKLAFIRTSSSSITGQAGFQSESLTRFFQADVRPSVSYRNIFSQKHDVDVSVYGEYVKQIAKGFSFTGYGTDPKRPNTPAAITQGNADNQLYSSVGGSKSQNSLLSGLAIARYTYDGKYTLNGSYRYDGSSKLPKDTRWQGFYSVGAIWEASKESFLQNISAINTLRLRVSYGGSGNSDNFPGGDYPYFATYDQGAYSGLNTIYASSPGNPNLKWEVTKVLNIGIDYELFNRRIYGDINLYDKRTTNLFVQKTLALESGFGSMIVNAGELQNKGIELTLNADVVRSRDVVWTVFGNAAYNKNKVLSLGGEPSYPTGTEQVTVGKPLGSNFEVKWGGVDAATGQPLYYDLNGNLTTTYVAGNAVQEFGTWESPWKGGFGSRVSFKGFDLSVLFSWQHGAMKTNNLEYFMENPVGFLGVGYNQANTLNFWKKPGDIASTPSPLYGTNFSSKIIEDASFMRLKDVTLSYTLPKNLLEKVKYISNVRFYAQGSNLYIWTKWRGMDPEAGAVNINLSEYPNPRAFTFGLDVTF